MTITVTAPDEVTVLAPPTPDMLGELVVVSADDVVETTDADRRQSIWRLRLESYAAGRKTIPPIRLATRRPGKASTTTIQSQPMAVRVKSATGLFASVSRPRDIVEVVQLRRGLAYWAPRVVGALVVGALLIVACRRCLLRESAEQWALRELDRLDWRRLDERWETERAIAALDAVVRKYLERVANVRADSASHGELLRIARQSPAISNEQAEMLGAFLGAVETAKFAPVKSSLADVRLAAELAREFVLQAHRGAKSPSQPRSEVQG